MTNKTDLPRIRIKPLNDLVLLQRKKEPERTAGGLHIPDKKNPTHGKVIECRVLAVGPGNLDTAVAIEALPPATPGWPRGFGERLMPVAVGDVVLVCEEALHPVSHDGLDLDFCQAGSLFGAVELD